MMKLFYGVYLESNRLSNALALIRYFGQPDNLRFSHITLRGPYSHVVARKAIDHWNTGRNRRWSVRLAGPGSFFDNNQNTVIVKVDLLDLADLVYKPDFADSTPHLTLYDGNDPVYAKNLLQILHKYDFHHEIGVSQVTKLDAKAPIGGDFMLLYQDFYANYCKIVGSEPSTAFAKALRNSEKINYIERVLAENFTQHYSNLSHRAAASPIKINQNLEFEF